MFFSWAETIRDYDRPLLYSGKFLMYVCTYFFVLRWKHETKKFVGKISVLFRPKFIASKYLPCYFTVLHMCKDAWPCRSMFFWIIYFQNKSNSSFDMEIKCWFIRVRPRIILRKHVQYLPTCLFSLLWTWRESNELF